MLRRYRRHLKEYGYERVIKSPDFLLSLCITGVAYFISISDCSAKPFLTDCSSQSALVFIQISTKILAPITSVVVTGLAILVSFTDKEFLSELSNINVFNNIVFIFEHTIFLALFTLLLGVYLSGYYEVSFFYYIFLFFFLYTMFSVTYLIEMLVELSINKSNWVEEETED